MSKITIALVNNVGYFKNGNDTSRQGIDAETIDKLEQEVIQHEPLLESLILILLKTKDNLIRSDTETSGQPGYIGDDNSLNHCRLMQLLGLISKLKGNSSGGKDKFGMQNKIINMLIMQLQLEIDNNSSFKDQLLELNQEAKQVVEQI
jgi:hypothetical protein